VTSLPDDTRRYADCLEVFLCEAYLSVQQALEDDAFDERKPLVRYAQLHAKVTDLHRRMAPWIHDMANRKTRLFERKLSLDAAEALTEGEFDPEDPESNPRGCV
jgi:hypothetical protein